MTIGNLKSNTWISIILVIVNVVLINLIVGHLGRMRLDVTEGEIYSLSDVTERILENLDERVTLRAYVSARKDMPEELRPFVPEIENLLDEYRERSNGMIEVIRVVPEEDQAAEQDAQSRFGVEAMPFVYQSAREQGVSSYYMSIVVQYASASHATISPADLIKQDIFDPEGRLELKNLEFALTGAIKKAIAGFEGQRDLFESFPFSASITTYFSPEDELPELVKEMPARTDKVLSELAADSGGKLTYQKRVVKAEEKDALYASSGIPPIPFGRDTEFFLWADLSIDGEPGTLVPLLSTDGALGEFELKSMFVETFKRMTPGLVRTVGIAQHGTPPNPMMPPGQQPPSPFEYLGSRLKDYEVRRLDFASLTRVPPEVDVLLVMEPRDIGEKALFAIDQFIMRGGKTIFCVDRHDAELRDFGDLQFAVVDSGCQDMLSSWGIEISEEVAFDTQCDDFPWTRSKAAAMGMPTRRRPPLVDFRWPAIPLIGYDPDSVNRDVQFLNSFEFATMFHASALKTKDVEGLKSTWLLRTSPEGWLQSQGDGMLPDVAAHETYGFAVPEESQRGRHDLAVLLEGKFKSWFADRPIPRDEGGDGDTEEGDEEGEKDEGPTAPLDLSPETRVIVFGDADWVHNIQAQIPPPYGRGRENTRALIGAIRWLLEDDDLAGIRGRGRSHRPLRRLGEDEQSSFRTWNIIIPLLALSSFGLALFAVRRNRRPLITEANA